MNISGLIEAWEKYGLKGLLAFVLLFLLITAIKSKWVGEIISKISEYFMQKVMKSRTKGLNVTQVTTSDIENNDIFSYVNLHIHSKLPTLQLSTNYRTAVFKKYLELYLRAYSDNIKTYVLSKEYEDMDQAMLSTSLNNLINDVVYDYESKAQLAGIPPVIINKMKIQNNDSIYLCTDLLDNICGSTFYASEKNRLKMFSILNIILSILESTLLSTEKVCNSINGQLKGLTFGGYTEP